MDATYDNKVSKLSRHIHNLFDIYNIRHSPVYLCDNYYIYRDRADSFRMNFTDCDNYIRIDNTLGCQPYYRINIFVEDFHFSNIKQMLMFMKRLAHIIFKFKPQTKPTFMDINMGLTDMLTGYDKGQFSFIYSTPYQYDVYNAFNFSLDALNVSSISNMMQLISWFFGAETRKYISKQFKSGTPIEELINMKPVPGDVPYKRFHE